MGFDVQVTRRGSSAAADWASLPGFFNTSPSAGTAAADALAASAAAGFLSPSDICNSESSVCQCMRFCVTGPASDLRAVSLV